MYETLSSEKLGMLSPLGLAYIGDGVYELMVRTYLCKQGNYTAGKLHRKAVALTSAKTQSKLSEKLLSMLNEDEKAVYMRARNKNARNLPKNADREEYQKATALEAVFGFLYLTGDLRRLENIFEAFLLDI